MKEIEKGSKKELVLQIVITIVVGLAIWPLFDLLFCAVLSHSEFKYSIFDHVVEPIIFGIIVGYIFWHADKKKTEKKK